MAHQFNKDIAYIENSDNPNTLNIIPVSNAGKCMTLDGTKEWNYNNALAPGSKWVEKTASTSGITFTPGIANKVAFWADADTLDNDTNLHWDDVNQRLGIGQTTPAKLLDVNGDALINGLTVGRGAGNASTNTSIGANALSSNTTGSNNTASGLTALQNNVAGYQNTANGAGVLQNNTEGHHNTANGAGALFYNTTGNYNTASGVGALSSNTTGNQNTASGRNALYSNTTGSFNSALGFGSGSFIFDGFTNNTITDNSVYVGYDSRALADNQTNQIVIGHTAIGGGSNTATIGNSSVTVLYLAGSVGWFQGNGTPEGVVAAPVGSFYSRKNGGAGTSFYVKESGSGNTGWIAK
jgi:hypothetical protein